MWLIFVEFGNFIRVPEDAQEDTGGDSATPLANTSAWLVVFDSELLGLCLQVRDVQGRFRTKSKAAPPVQYSGLLSMADVHGAASRNCARGVIGFPVVSAIGPFGHSPTWSTSLSHPHYTGLNYLACSSFFPPTYEQILNEYQFAVIVYEVGTDFRVASAANSHSRLAGFGEDLNFQAAQQLRLSS